MSQSTKTKSEQPESAGVMAYPKAIRMLNKIKLLNSSVNNGDPCEIASGTVIPVIDRGHLEAESELLWVTPDHADVLIVTGYAKGIYDEQPTRVQVDKIEPISETQRFPTVSDIYGIDTNFTGGVPSDEYVRSLRSA